MATLAPVRNTAHDLMRQALEMLDGIDEYEAAIHLQQAIDTLVGEPIPQTEEEFEAAMEKPEIRRILDRMDRRVRSLGSKPPHPTIM